MRVSVAALLLSLLFGASASSQANFVIPNTAFPTIQSAINASVAGDLIVVWAGVYNENLDWPTHDVHIQGAGIGQSIIDGGGVRPCVTFKGASSNASILEGFTLRNGKGRLSNYGAYASAGGGLYLVDDASGIPEPCVRACEITACSAQQASAIYMWNAGTAVFEDLTIEHNVEVPFAIGPNEVAGIEITESNSAPTFRRCLVQGHDSSGLTSFSSLIRIKNGASAFFEDCVFQKNKINGSLLRINAANVVCLDRCRLEDNVLNGTTMDGFANAIAIRDSLIARNAGGGGLIFNSPCEIVGCTLADNTRLSGAANPSASLVWGQAIDIRNSIVWGNHGVLGGVLTAPLQGTIQVDHCDVQLGGGTGTAGIDADPLFANPLVGDYRILPDSPCLDSGESSPPGGLTLADLRGLPRLRLGDVDMGCLEGQHMAHHPASKGRVGENAGGPFEILQINGAGGGSFRTVKVPTGISSTVTMLQPPHLALPAKFAIFGYVGEAGLDTVVTVPLGISEMVFAPAPMVVPQLPQTFFTYTNNLSPASPQLVQSTDTTWVSAPGPAVSVPLKITFQGIVEESPGVYRPTNAVIFCVE